MVGVLERQSVTADEGERRALAELERLLSGDGGLFVLGRKDSNGEETVALPGVAVRLLRGVVHHLAQGHAITFFPLSERLTTQEAAEILNVSRPHVVKLLESGVIPFERVNVHRRIKPEDLLAYKQRRDAERRERLAEMARETDELGLYEVTIGPEDLEE